VAQWHNEMHPEAAGFERHSRVRKLLSSGDALGYERDAGAFRGCGGERSVLTHFITSRDVERSAGFYRDVLGGEVVSQGEPTVISSPMRGSSSTWAAAPLTTAGGHPRATGRLTPNELFSEHSCCRHPEVLRRMEAPRGLSF
jgi:hypothetical protein